jgi:hypothetical protein
LDIRKQIEREDLVLEYLAKRSSEKLDPFDLEVFTNNYTLSTAALRCLT